MRLEEALVDRSATAALASGAARSWRKVDPVSRSDVMLTSRSEVTITTANPRAKPRQATPSPRATAAVRLHIARHAHTKELQETLCPECTRYPAHRRCRSCNQHDADNCLVLDRESKAGTSGRGKPTHRVGERFRVGTGPGAPLWQPDSEGPSDSRTQAACQPGSLLARVPPLCKSWAAGHWHCQWHTGPGATSKASESSP